MPKSRQHSERLSKSLAQAAHDQGESPPEIARPDEDDGADQFVIGYGGHPCSLTEVHRNVIFMIRRLRNGNDDSITMAD